MKTLRKIILGLLAFIAWIVIDVGTDMPLRNSEEMLWGRVIEIHLVVLSVIYWHWLFRVFSMPLSNLTPPARSALQDRASAQYSRSFLRGTIGFGYLCLALWALGMTLADMPERELKPGTFIWVAIGFIGLGTLAQARGLILTLTDDVSKTSVQSDAPAKETEPHRSP